MRNRSVILYVDLRRSPLEHRAAIEAAHRQGHGVALITGSAPPNLPGRIVVAVHAVDMLDPATVDFAVDAIAREFRVAGVVTWSDAGVETAGRTASRLGLPGVPPAAARAARNKHLMRTALAGRPDLMPRFAPVRTWAEAEEAAARIAFPAVLKPVAGSGSKGIFLLPDERHLRPAFEELSRITQAGADRIFHRDPGQLIYEEFMEGTEHSVEGFVHQGEVIVAGVTDKRTTEPFRLELAHVHPSALPADTLSAIDALTGVVIETLGLDDCAFHLECMSGPSGVKLVEVAARAGGDFIASHLVGLSTGVSFSENVVRVATGLAPVLGDRPVLYAGVHKIMAQEAGTLVRIDGVDEALRVPGVQHAVIDRAVGVEIRLPPTHFSSSVVGALIASGDSAESAWDTLETAVGAVRVEIAAPG